jgi:hypothetical protein
MVGLTGPGFAAAWKDKLAEELPPLGNRNWIVIADAAYRSPEAGPGLRAAMGLDQG